MSSREAILGRIRTALNAVPGTEVLPPMPDLWPQSQDSPDGLLDIFETSLKAAAGELVRCPTMEDAAQKGRELLSQLGAKRIGMVQRPLIEKISKNWGDLEKVGPPETPNEVNPQELAKLDAGVVRGEYLLADTGSCVMASPTAFDRLMCYLPPVCLVFVEKDKIRAHLQAAWPEISKRMTDADDPVGTMNQSGEFLIVTGPSRTADIEKILILGVHGPKRLIVFVIDESCA